MPRIFVAVPVAPPIRAALSELRRHSAPALRWVAERQFHITLKFLGEIDEADVDAVRRSVEKAAADTGAERLAPGQPARADTARGDVFSAPSPAAPGIDLSARGIGAFPNARSARVVWVGVDGDTDLLVHLQTALEKRLSAFGFERDERRFRPHITVARARRPQPLPDGLRQYADREFGRWRADTVEVIESRLTPAGPIYTVRHRIRLGS